MLISEIAKALCWCETVSDEWAPVAESKLAKLEARLPSGSGIDAGTEIVRDRCTSTRIVLRADYHHMDEHGFYTKWTSHTITVRPCLTDGFELTITRGGIRDDSFLDYLYDVFYAALCE